MKVITKFLSLFNSFLFFRCNCCGFRTLGLKNKWGDYICLSCGSSTRSRLLCACLQFIEELSYMKLIWNKSILHCAPERPTTKYLSAHSGQYVRADYFASRYKNSRFIDLNIENKDFPSSNYDCIICLDVLEHVPSASNALREIHRLLKVDGCFISSVPIPFGLSSTTEATMEQQSDAKTLTRIFGIPDHLRMFGSDYEILLRQYFGEVKVIKPSSFSAYVRRRHLLTSNIEIVKPLATRNRQIFFAYKK